MKNIRTTPFLAGLAGLLMKEKYRVPVVPSHKIERKKEVEQQLSKRQIQKMKGKKTRKNRGRNRKTTKYGSLRDVKEMR